jgi:putative CocE/NonD family hydrolase
MDGPWYHVTAPGGIDLEAVQLAWFDHWLKGRPTGIARTPTPMHLYTLGSGDWVNATRYPLDQARPTTLYLGGGPSGSGAPSRNDGRLTDSPPSANSGADTVAFVPVTSPCDRQTEQWGAGGGALALGTLGLADPCTNDDRTLEAGPGSLTYTSAPFAADRVVAGPIDATIYASSTRPETFFEVTLEDVKPNGSATPLTSGGLLGSFRALDADRSWLAGDGNPILPYHPYTRSSSSPVVPGKVSRYDVEVFPTFARIPAGDRLRVTITTGDTPHLGFTPQELAQLAGGVYAVERNSGAASFVEVPLARPDSVATPCDVCTPTG